MRAALAGSLGLVATFGATAALAQLPDVGVGVVQPSLDPARPLYFYGAPQPGVDPSTATPIDSVTFAAGDHFVGIATAPPWFAPEGLKLDYDLLWLRARTLTRAWIEVEVNTIEPRPRFVPETAWVAREAVTFRPWTEFLLEVFSVETLDPAANAVRAAPHGDSEVVADSDGRALRPLAIRGEWLRVEAVEGTEADRFEGWVRWRGSSELLVSFSMLS